MPAKPGPDCDTLQPPASAPDGLPARRGQRRTGAPHPIWLAPILAALIALALLVQTLSARGPEVIVTFRSADGLVPGKTTVRYKAVEIGRLEAIRLAPDHSHVVATIALSREARDFAAKGTRFWVVRPRVALSGISGLETVLSGSYIGVDAARSHQQARSFAGLEAPPAVTSDSAGTQFMLEAADLGSLDIGSPVYYRRVPVGRVVGYQFEANGRDLSVRVFIDRPYDKLVTTDARFWHASGLDLKLGSEGLRLHTQSLATVVLGGIAFQRPDDSADTAMAAENTRFPLAADQAVALKPSDETAPVLAVLNFDQSVRGLAPGAPVDFRGIVVGQVRSIGIQYLRDTQSFRMPVVVELYPTRLGLSRLDLADKQRGRRIGEAMNQRGLRAQLRTGSLLTGQLYVAFDFFPQAAPVQLSLDSPLPELPTIPGTFDSLQARLGSIVAKLDKVPFDRIGNDVRTSLTSLNQLLVHTDEMAKAWQGDLAPQIAAVLQESRRTLGAAQAMLDTGSPMQQDTRRMLREVARAAGSLRALSDYLEVHPEALLRGKGKQAEP